MAITIVNQTSAALTNTSHIVTIPSTTAGNVIIASVSTIAGSSQFVQGIIDNIQGFPYWTQTASGTRTDGGVRRTVCVHYRENIEAGITTVNVVPNDASGMNMYVIIYEVAGIAVSSSLETQTTVSGTDSGTTTSGPSLATAFSTAFFVTPGVRGSAANWSSANGYTQSYSVSAGVSTSTHGYKIASGTNQVTYTHPSGAAIWISGLAVFKPYVPSKSSSMLLMFE